ncbi:MAG: hydrolase TatD [Bacteroidetes bacterium HGW-Bacteroidetes-6]|jgi:TatD DNase family protein|nr:MAG: hydrolase TatD [Bacteroidetes bacterium HGW-Bacteroidetes-6]
MRIIDTHSHLYLPEFEEDLDDVVRRARAEGVVHALLPDIDNGTTNILKRTIIEFPGFFSGMTGIHPTSVNEDWREQLEHFESEIVSGFPWVAIGEIGIDLYWDATFAKAQKTVFEAQLNKAVELNLPVSVHQRNSMKEVLDVLQLFKGKVTGVLHCFSGNNHDADLAIELGLKLGIGGVLTFKNSNLPEIVKHVGVKHLVLETDAPYLAPMPLRGKRNEPAYLKYVLTYLAQLLNLPTEEAANHLFINSTEIFSKISIS